jgi:hypothetical protein
VKKWYQSKTIIANIVAVVASIAAGFGVDVLADVELQAEIVVAALAVTNIGLRFITDKPVA